MTLLEVIWKEKYPNIEIIYGCCTLATGPDKEKYTYTKKKDLFIRGIDYTSQVKKKEGG